MTIFEVEAHSRAVASIQALLSKHRPGSFPYRIAERALDLAFNSLCVRGAAPEQELLAEAETLIKRQVRAKLLSESTRNSPSAAFPSKRDPVRPRYLAWHSTVRPRVVERFAQAELWLTTEEHGGDGHALIR